MLGIMAGMDQEAWFAGFDVVPRAVLLLVSQAPGARHHGRLGPQDSVEGSQVQFLDKVFSMPVVVLRVSWSRQCFTQFGVSALAVLHGRRFPVAVQRPIPCRP